MHDDQQRGADRSALRPEDVATYPLPGMAGPSDFAFRPDDRVLSYLFSPDGTLTKHLFACDVTSGQQRLLLAAGDGGTTEHSMTLEEALRRERQRQRALGVTTYAWADHAPRLIVPLPDGLYVLDGETATPRRLLATVDGPIIDPQISPDGTRVAFVRDRELHTVAVAGGEPYPVTAGAGDDTTTHGLAEYIAQEEMGRSHGFWWSADSASLAFTSVDDADIPAYRIIHQGKDHAGASEQEDHRYPFAGAANAAVRLGVVSARGGATRWLDLAAWRHEYVARVDWAPDGALFVQLENRLQSELTLIRFSPESEDARALLVERSDTWINLHSLLRPLRTGEFIWASERSGFRHLYLYDADGALVRPVTQGNWLVESIALVDEERRLIFFTGTLDSPVQRQLYVVSLDEGVDTPPRRLTAGVGMHAVVADHAGACFVDVYQALDVPPTATVRSLIDGRLLLTLPYPRDRRLDTLDLQAPEIVTITGRSNVVLFGAIYRPPTSFGPGPYPTIVAVYGGPHVQTVNRGWSTTVNMRAQYWRSLGFLVFALDNRGSARRGLAFEGAIRHSMGTVEVADQVDGVRWLVDRGLTDPRRVALCGWSYGGYMAVSCLLKAPETFQVAVAGAPVTAWDGYDTHYTERYMGLPQTNAASYRESSVLSHAAALRGRLLLIHGLIDENVHFRHTARLVNALIAARKPYDLLVFPNERHMPRGFADRVYMEERIAAYFQQHL